MLCYVLSLFRCLEVAKLAVAAFCFSQCLEVAKAVVAAISGAFAPQSSASVPRSLSSAAQFTFTALSSLSAATRYAATTSSASVASFQSVSSNHAAPSYPSERDQHPKVHLLRYLQLCFH